MFSVRLINVLVQQHVATDRITAKSFLLMIEIEASHLFPSYHCKYSVQGIQVSNLNVFVVFVVFIIICKRHSAAGSLARLGRTCRNAQNTSECVILCIQTHAHIDEQDTELLQFLDDELLTRASINAQKNACHLAQLIDIGLVHVRVVRNDTGMQP